MKKKGDKRDLAIRENGTLYTLRELPYFYYNTHTHTQFVHILFSKCDPKHSFSSVSPPDVVCVYGMVPPLLIERGAVIKKGSRGRPLMTHGS